VVILWVRARYFKIRYHHRWLDILPEPCHSILL